VLWLESLLEPWYLLLARQEEECLKFKRDYSINGNSQPYIIDGIYIDNSSIASGGLNAVSRSSKGYLVSR
jgi:hypothetical protein